MKSELSHRIQQLTHVSNLALVSYYELERHRSRYLLVKLTKS